MGLKQAIRPSQDTDIGRRVIFQVDHYKVHPARTEQLVMIIVVRTEMTTIVIAPQEARFTEILIVEVRCAVRVASWRLIVVAYCNAIRHTLCHPGCGWILDDVESGICILPFDLKLIAMLGAVA